MVGGEINYRCLGNDQYEIMVTVFRDCDTGVPWFDDPASVGVFDQNDSLIYDLRLSLRNNDTLDLNLTDPCLVAPPNVCIHTTTYIDTVTLPFQAGGYQIVYQRCCRNQDIVNIVAPTSTGATYSSFISEQALLACNTSARFVEWPPVYICAGVPIVYDHSAVDPDGDSIVYELCTPFTGATPTQSMPQPPNNPPYNPVTWLPPYSVDNMLGGPDSLKINSNTGLLTGTPDILGVFVVGVCAREYRNGILISTTRRDFQYVVGQCGRLVSSSFFAPSIQCDNSLIVSFQNNSTSLGTGFVWSFGDSTNPSNSTFSNPTYIYPDTGRYTVTLIADPGTLCADTSIQEIYLQYESILTNFDLTTARCSDSLIVDVTDLTIDTISTITNWSWDFGNGQTANIPYPTAIYDSAGTYIVRLDVQAANGCIASYLDTISIDLPRIFSADTVGICAGDSSVLLNPGGNPNHQYQWSPATGLDDPTIASPTANPNGTTTYGVTVTVPNGVDTCVLERTITVVYPPPIQLDVFRDTFTCQDSILITTTTNATLLEWSADVNFNAILYTGNSIYIPVPSFLRLFVRATDPYGCSLVDTVDVFRRLDPLNVNWTYQTLVCDTSFTVQFTDLTVDSSGGALQAWYWDFGDNTRDSTQSPTHTYSQSGTYTVSLEVVSLDGCRGSLSQTITVLIPQLAGNDTLGICPGNTSVQLNPNGNPNLLYQWSPSNTLSSSTAVSPIASPSTPTTYTVTITAINGGDTCVNIEQVHVNFPPPVTVSLPSTTVYCGNTVTIQATTNTGVTFEWAGDPSFNNILGTGNPFTGVPLTAPLAIYYVRATDPYGCTATDFGLVQQNTTPIVVDFAYQSLGCSDTIALQFTDLTVDSANNPIISWLWTTSDGQSSTQQNPIFVFSQNQPTSVTLEVTLQDGCTGSVTESLEFNLATLTSDTLIVLCDGITSTQLNAGGNPSLDYQWSPATGLSATNIPSPIASPPSTPFTYTANITGYSALDTCVSIQSITVVQAPPIMITVPKDTVTCSGVFNIQASITNANSIEWSFNPFFSPVAIANVTSFFVGLPAPPFTLQMYVRVTDQYGCVATDTARIIRQNIPIPVSFVIDPGACDDTLSATFTNTTAIPAGLQVNSYSWDYGNGSTGTGYNGASQYTANGTYPVQLTMTSTNGCTGTFIDSLRALLPTFNGKDSIGLCGQDSVALNPGGNPNLSYQWSPATGLSDPTAANPIASPSTTTTYRVFVTAFNSTDTCSSLYEVVVSVDSFELQAMGDTALCENNIALQALAPTATQLNWALDRDFNLLIGTGNPLLTNINDPRWFYVQGQDGFGCEAIDSVFVNYRGTEIPVDFSMSPLNCGDSLIIQFQDQNQDTTIVSWNWNLGNGQTASIANPISTYYADSTYTISLAVQGTGNCNGTISKQLDARIPRLALPNPQVTLCQGDSLNFGLTSDPDLRYEWLPTTGLSDPTSGNPTFFPSSTTTYTVRVYGYSNIDGQIDTCFIEDSLTISLQAAPTVQIQADTSLCTASFLATAQSTSAGQYAWARTADFQTILSTASTLQGNLLALQEVFYLQITDSAGCTAIDSVELVQHPVDISLPALGAACGADSLGVMVTNNLAQTPLSYTWSYSAILNGQNTDSVTVLVPTTGTAVLQVVATNSFGCTDSTQTLLVKAPDMNLQVSPDQVICDSAVSLMASATNGAQYQWAADPAFATILSQNSMLSTNALAIENVYYVVAEDSFGCRALDSVKVGTYPVSVRLDSLELFCTGPTTVPLNAIATGNSDSLWYTWTISNTNGTTTQQGDNDTLPVFLPVGQTLVTVQVRNQYGCIANDTSQVLLTNTTIPLSISTDKDTVAVGEQAQLLATLQNNYQYSWLVDSTLSSDSIYNPIAQPVQTTTYYLTVTDPLGCFAEDSITIYFDDPICDETTLFVPNAFSPNGDGTNDVIYVAGNSITEVYFVIYNRWGEQVFETKDQARGWDGKYKGQDCAPDVFGYYLRCRCLDGYEIIRKGNITLLR